MPQDLQTYLPGQLTTTPKLHRYVHTFHIHSILHPLQTLP